MLKSSRLSVVFAFLVVLILLVQITAFAGNTQSQEPSADSKTSRQSNRLRNERRKSCVSALLGAWLRFRLWGDASRQ